MSIDWPQTLARLQERLPELEHQILKFGLNFPLYLLPAPLFRDIQQGEDCIRNITQDLEHLATEKSAAIQAYLSERISQKIHVLVHICRTQPTKQIKPSLDKMSTRMQWLEERKLKHNRLTTQRAAIATTLETMRSCEDLAAVAKLQKELHSIDQQLTELLR